MLSTFALPAFWTAISKPNCILFTVFIIPVAFFVVRRPVSAGLWCSSGKHTRTLALCPLRPYQGLIWRFLNKMTINLKPMKTTSLLSWLISWFSLSLSVLSQRTCCTLIPKTNQRSWSATSVSPRWRAAAMSCLRPAARQVTSVRLPPFCSFLKTFLQESELVPTLTLDIM